MYSVKASTQRWIAFIWLTATISACAPTVQTTAKVRPNFAEAADIRRVAVIGFRGQHSDRINPAFETMLVNHRFDDKPYFTVVDRTRTDDLMREYGRALRGEIEPRTAARFGKQIGVQGVYYGDIAKVNITSRNYTAEQSYCSQYSSSGNKCRKFSKRSVSCSERVANVTLVPRLINVETGQIIYRAERTGTSRASRCNGESGKSDDELLDEAITIAVGQIRADIAPNVVLTSVRLMEAPSTLDPIATEEFSRGLAFAKAQRMDRACSIWNDLNKKTQGSDNALLYNVAVCEEIQGNHKSALGLLEQVDSRLDRPDRNVSDALQRIKSTLATE